VARGYHGPGGYRWGRWDGEFPRGALDVEGFQGKESTTTPPFFLSLRFFAEILV